MEDRIYIFTMQCRRGCGRSVSVFSQSLHGNDDLHAKYHGICDACLTPGEIQEIDAILFAGVGLTAYIINEQ